jgi:hypothetical protein
VTKHPIWIIHRREDRWEWIYQDDNGTVQAVSGRTYVNPAAASQGIKRFLKHSNLAWSLDHVEVRKLSKRQVDKS